MRTARSRARRLPGQHRKRVQVRALLRGRRRPGGRVQQRQEDPASQARRQWVATMERRSTSARGASAAWSVTVFSMSTRNRRSGNGAGASEIDRRSRADSGHRVRTRWAKSSAASPNGSVCSSPGSGIELDVLRSAELGATATARSNSFGTASSNVRWRSPPTSSSSNSTNAPSAPRRRTDRRCSCRNRSRTPAGAAASPPAGIRSAAATRPPSPATVSRDRPARLDPRSGREHAELPAHPVLRRRTVRYG